MGVGVYTRIADDQAGLGAGVARQEEDGLAAALRGERDARGFRRRAASTARVTARRAGASATGWAWVPRVQGRLVVMDGTGTRSTVAGRYELGERLGRGGTGEVYRGRDLRLNRPVAVKRLVLPPELDGAALADLRARVLREARAAARINHAGSVEVYDVLDEDGLAFIVMELVDGPDLGRVLAERGRLPAEEVARIGLDLLTVLEQAHAAGVVHRDVKPANVLLAPGRPPALTDFGTALLAGDDRLTASGLVFGSPAYMSPEQAVGREVGPATDLWSLGATLYHALEGVTPFAANSAIATARLVVDADPRPLTATGPVAEAITGLLAKDPAARADPASTRRRLEAALAPPERTGTALTATAAPAAARPWTAVAPQVPARRRFPLALVMAVAALLVAATAAALVVTRPQPVTEPAGTPVAGQPPAAPGTAPPDPAPSTPAVTAAPEATAPPPAATAPPSTATAPPSTTTAPPSMAATEAPVATDPGTAAAVPDGWVAFAPEDAPYEVAHPARWEVRRLDATRTDLVDPGSGTYLRLDWTDDPQPDPVADWEAYEQDFAAGRAGYERIRLEPTTFDGEPAALWEYAYDARGGRVHAYNLNVSGEEYGYALNFQSSEAAWDTVEPLFWELADTYRIVG